MNQMRNSFVRPHVNHGNIILNMPQPVRPLVEGSEIDSHFQMKKAVQVRYQAALAVAGACEEI